MQEWARRAPRPPAPAPAPASPLPSLGAADLQLSYFCLSPARAHFFTRKSLRTVHCFYACWWVWICPVEFPYQISILKETSELLKVIKSDSRCSDVWPYLSGILVVFFWQSSIFLSASCFPMHWGHWKQTQTLLLRYLSITKICFLYLLLSCPPLLSIIYIFTYPTLKWWRVKQHIYYLTSLYQS